MHWVDLFLAVRLPARLIDQRYGQRAFQVPDRPMSGRRVSGFRQQGIPPKDRRLPPP